MIRRLEDFALAGFIVVLILLPTVHGALRLGGFGGVPGVGFLTQYLTLIIGMVGAMVAAREQRLLSLTTMSSATVSGWRAALSVPLNALAATVALLLAHAAWLFVDVERDMGTELAIGVPVWMILLIVPAGFAVLAVRFVLQGGQSWCRRTTTAAALALLLLVYANSDLSASWVQFTGIGLLVLAAGLGAPIFVVIGGAALILTVGSGLPAEVMALNHIELTTNPSLPAIPLFTAAGYILAESGAPKRLVRVFQALLGRSVQGAVLVTVVASTFFTCFTGASGVAILALGGLVMPLLLASGASQSRALGMVTGAGVAGALVLPALPIILYATIAQLDIEALFLAGLIPASVLFSICVVWGMVACGRGAQPLFVFSRGEFSSAVWAAKWELALPLGVAVALLAGFATAVETAALAAAAALVLEVVVHRDIHPVRELPGVLSRCGLLVGGILLVLGVAMGLTNYLVDAEVPTHALEMVTSLTDERLVFLLILNVFLILAGFFVDIFSAIVILVPLLLPMADAFGIHPVHLAMVFLANLQLGYLTPPVGMNLFFASYRFERPIPEVIRAVLPLFPWLLLGVLTITFVPALSTWLPGVLRGVE